MFNYRTKKKKHQRPKFFKMNYSINKDHFSFFRNFFAEKTGISLDDSKLYLLETRLLPIIKRHNLNSFDELILALKTNKEIILNESVDAISTNETFFFRDIKPFNILGIELLKKLAANENAKNNKLRFWSAACSKGQEAYSIAISILENRNNIAGMDFEIIGTDISSEVVEKAKTGIFNSFEIQRGLPVKLMIKYFDKLENGHWKAKDELMKHVKFEKRNLLEDTSDLGIFDCIFCRYVLIYFEDEKKREIANKLVQQLRKNGYFFTGTSETRNFSEGELKHHQDIRSIFQKI